MEKTLQTVSTAKKPWITQTTLQLADEKRKCKNSRLQSAEKMSEYRRMCNRVRKSARKDKNKWIREQCEAIEEAAIENRSREVYRLVRRVSGKMERPRISAIKNSNGEVLYSKEDVLGRWTEYCKQLYTEDRDMDERVREINGIAPPADHSNLSIMTEEVEAAMRKLKAHKAPGTDGIPSELLLAGEEITVHEVFDICNDIWTKEKLPDQWSQSIVVPIPKKGDTLNCSNYRTLSLVNHSCKIMLLILLERLKRQIEPHLSEEQAGFRRDRGTVQHILTLRLIGEKMWRKNKDVYNCFIDFRKAFDTTNHDVLWATLRSYGVNDKLINVLRAVYRDARACVRVGQELGDWFRLGKGNRQAYPLSPASFTIYLERVLDRLKEMDGVNIQGL